MSELQSKIRYIIEFIEKRANSAIVDSIVIGDSYNPLSSSARPTNNTDRIQWIGKDIESLQGIWDDTAQMNLPCYSGFVDVEGSSGVDISTPFSNLDCVTTIQESLTQIGVVPALYFVNADMNGTAEQRFWDADPKSLFEVNTTRLNILLATNIDTILPLIKEPAEISERYFLSYSAFAISLEGSSLYFYDNYRPWNGQVYSDGRRNLISDNISTFQVWGESAGTILRLNVCVTQKLSGLNDDAKLCKEAVIAL